jgi:virulence-associated protein VapD
MVHLSDIKVVMTKGFQQTQGLCYDETFKPVAHMTIVHTLIVVAASSSWTFGISQMDVKMIFFMVFA